WGRLIDMIVYPISYVRIMGFGFASVLIASVINDAFTPDIGSGIGVFLLYLVVFVILHALNMALSTLEGAIQSVRLNFLEFFEEFYTGKGVKFRPFAYRRIHTYE
ncbi:MAG: V-type ATP synthase subunit I, partial [Candidatus Micrarchaeota archaeon]|nr:V-type ATP synthase subunit I [Candidatus Micrarchaeota archaeon]